MQNLIRCIPSRSRKTLLNSGGSPTVASISGFPYKINLLNIGQPASANRSLSRVIWIRMNSADSTVKFYTKCVYFSENAKSIMYKCQGNEQAHLILREVEYFQFLERGQRLCLHDSNSRLVAEGHLRVGRCGAFKVPLLLVRRCGLRWRCRHVLLCLSLLTYSHHFGLSGDHANSTNIWSIIRSRV